MYWTAVLVLESHFSAANSSSFYSACLRVSGILTASRFPIWTWDCHIYLYYAALEDTTTCITVVSMISGDINTQLGDHHMCFGPRGVFNNTQISTFDGNQIKHFLFPQSSWQPGNLVIILQINKLVDKSNNLLEWCKQFEGESSLGDQIPHQSVTLSLGTHYSQTQRRREREGMRYKPKRWDIRYFWQKAT